MASSQGKEGGAGGAPSAPAPPLTKGQHEAILDLASSLTHQPVNQKPSGPQWGERPAKLAGVGPVRIAVWDEEKQVKISGPDAPSEDELAQYLAKHPKCVVYAGQKQTARPVAGEFDRQQADDALAPSKLGARSLVLLTGAKAPLSDDGGSKRSQFTKEQLDRLQQEFDLNELPNKDTREQIATDLDISTRSIQIWFQNRRQRLKNQRMESGMAGLLRVAEHEHDSETAGIDSLAMISSLERETLPGGNKLMETRTGGGKKEKREKAAEPEKPEGFQWLSLDCSGLTAGGHPGGGMITGKLGWQSSPYDPNGMVKPPVKRTELTNRQLNTLMAQFKADKHPTNERREELARQLNMTMRSVQIWFQNRRQRDPSREQRRQQHKPVHGHLSMDDAQSLVKENERAQASEQAWKEWRASVHGTVQTVPGAPAVPVMPATVANGTTPAAYVGVVVGTAPLQRDTVPPSAPSRPALQPARPHAAANGIAPAAEVPAPAAASSTDAASAAASPTPPAASTEASIDAAFDEPPAKPAPPRPPVPAVGAKPPAGPSAPPVAEAPAAAAAPACAGAAAAEGKRGIGIGAGANQAGGLMWRPMKMLPCAPLQPPPRPGPTPRPAAAAPPRPPPTAAPSHPGASAAPGAPTSAGFHMLLSVGAVAPAEPQQQGSAKRQKV